MLWVIVYSPFVLKSILPSEHYDMWCVFSQSCSLFVGHLEEIVKADELIIQFCTLMFEDIFGCHAVTPKICIFMHIYVNAFKI